MEKNTAGRGRTALGRGIQSLIPLAKEWEKDSALREIAIHELNASSNQPRKFFDAKAISELASSIKEHGVLQPIVVRKLDDGTYEIVAGERRWRAAQEAKLKHVPCVVADLADDEVLTVALVENIQREDLNAIEEAESYRRLSDELGLTQEQIAKAVGKDRTTVTNMVRLLKLPKEVQSLLAAKHLSMGHARALLGLKESKSISKLAERIVEQGLSVRNAEMLVQNAQDPARDTKARVPLARKETAALKDMRLQLERALKTRVEILCEKSKGTIVVHFSDMDQLEDIFSRFLD